MNIKKVTLATTALIIAGTLSTSFAATPLNIQTEKVYVSENATNAIKFNLKDENYTVVGLYLGKRENLGTWTGKKCEVKSSSRLICQFKSSHGRQGMISFTETKDGSLQSTLQYKRKGKETESHRWTWHSA
ncbi:MAG: hypothetical protein CL816_06685 [Coxiellaceae bacterium]|nr:hypothetical protein [Coxiellaceae bacterium]|tara:strand:- start:1189 stop:1581 length:393 start_codon:yes stop_codon:yes gene_type:complete